MVTSGLFLVRWKSRNILMTQGQMDNTVKGSLGKSYEKFWFKAVGKF